MSAGAIEVDYRVRCAPAAAEGRAEALLLEQTVELPRSALRTAFVRESVVGRVVSITPVGENDQRVTLEQPLATAGSDPAQLLNVLFGNSSLQPDVELEDVRLPAELLASLGGPRFGIAGLRSLARVHGRALTASAIKPMGLSPTEAGALCRTLSLAGIDLVKDDHGLADHAFCPFRERVKACLAATLEAAQASGRRTLYVPNLIGTPGTVRAQASEARELGAEAVMVSPMLVGLPFLSELAASLGIPILAHPAFGGALRISPLALLGRLFPAFGADVVIFPNSGGRFSYSEGVCRSIASALRAPSGGILPAMPMPAGGIKAENVPSVMGFYGADTVLLIGGSLIDAPDEPAILARSRQFVAAVQAFSFSR